MSPLSVVWPGNHVVCEDRSELGSRFRPLAQSQRNVSTGHEVLALTSRRTEGVRKGAPLDFGMSVS